MVETGLGSDLAATVVDSVVASVAPFAAPGRLRTLVRDELARRVPVAPAAAPGRRTLAVVGPAGSGKTAAVAGIAVAHAGAGQTVACLAVDPHDNGAALRALVGDSGATVESIAAGELAAALATEAADLVLVDTPPVSPGAPAAVAALAAALRQARPDEIHLALRAGTAAGAGAALVAGLGDLVPTRMLVTAAAETGHVGGVLDVAIHAGLPLSYVAADAAEVAPADPRALASKVAP
jgi:flagellar biosynthesis GTPase FlhF